jgi:hypothetical protein
MRLMLRFTIPVEKGNQAEAEGALAMALKVLVEEVQPEAAYFHLQDGKRAGTVIFIESDQARIAEICEPLFAALNASIEIQPVISLEELLTKL